MNEPSLRPHSAGAEHRLARLFAENRGRLQRIVRWRLPRRLLARVDVDDILQEAYLDAAERLPQFRDLEQTSAFVWVRLIVLQTIANIHRRHLGVQMRAATREVIWPQHTAAEASATWNHLLADDRSSPSQALMREEAFEQVTGAIEQLKEDDRAIIRLRHFEELTNAEAAAVLGLARKAASARYIRAIARLRELIGGDRKAESE